MADTLGLDEPAINETMVEVRLNEKERVIDLTLAGRTVPLTAPAAARLAEDLNDKLELYFHRQLPNFRVARIASRVSKQG